MRDVIDDDAGAQAVTLLRQSVSEDSCIGKTKLYAGELSCQWCAAGVSGYVARGMNGSEANGFKQVPAHGKAGATLTLFNTEPGQGGSSGCANSLVISRTQGQLRLALVGFQG